jgi:hypothetical protein
MLAAFAAASATVVAVLPGPAPLPLANMTSSSPCHSQAKQQLLSSLKMITADDSSIEGERHAQKPDIGKGKMQYMPLSRKCC